VPAARAVLPLLNESPVPSGDKVTLAEVRQRMDRGDPVILLDVRTERSYRDGTAMAKGAIRIPPDSAAQRAAELALPRESWLVAYCT
jgi:rhodanese-related sulfurtransferase